MRTSPKRGRPARLTQDIVVAEALSFVREHGLPSLTMRALADRLGSSPMALYRHVGSRENLARLVTERTLASVSLPVRAKSVVAWFRETAMRVRQVAIAHPGIMELLAQEGPAVHSALVILDQTVLRLHDAGLSWTEATDLHNAFFSWLAGTIRREDSWRLSAGDAEQALAHSWHLAESIPANEMPGLAAALPHLRTRSADAEFETSLEIMLEAVQVIVRRARRQR